MQSAMEVDVEKLKQLRLERGLSQRQLAVQAGIANTTLANLEARRSGAHPSTLRKLADVLGVSPLDLMEQESKA
jgi:transcriptional regulator with XRE-family HTH domain